MQKITITHAQAGRRLDNHLIKALPGAGLSFIHKMLRKKNITVNGRKCEGNYRLAEGDEICMFFSDETYAKLSSLGQQVNITSNTKEYTDAYASLSGIDIIYEDRDFIFIDKPAGVLSQKAAKTDRSVNEWLVGYLLDKGELTEDSLGTFKPAFANRLDRNTSGLMLGGKSLAALQLLSGLLRDRDMHKFYLCVACGQPDDKLPVSSGGFTHIYAYLVKDHASNTVQVYPDPDQARKAASDTGSDGSIRQTSDDGVSEIHTGFRLVRMIENGSDHNRDSKDARMLLEVELHTGKSHQIRAQLASLGHPIEGDPKYGVKLQGIRRGGESKSAASPGQMLLAYRVVFPELPAWPAISGREFMSSRQITEE